MKPLEVLHAIAAGKMIFEPLTRDEACKLGMSPDKGMSDEDAGRLEASLNWLERGGCIEIEGRSLNRVFTIRRMTAKGRQLLSSDTGGKHV